MSRKQYSLSKQLVVTAALALGASGGALADDSSMSRFGGESYAYFSQPVRDNSLRLVRRGRAQQQNGSGETKYSSHSEFSVREP